MNDVLCIVLMLVLLPPLTIILVYFVVKAARAGWLRANELFVRDEIKRILQQKDQTNGDDKAKRT